MKIINPFLILKKKFSKSIKTEELDIPKKNKSALRIDQSLDSDYEIVKIHQIGFADPFAMQGALILTTDDGKKFPISAFSGEIAKYISNFTESKLDSLPTIYNMIEQICEECEIMLVKVKLYESGDALRANLYFTGIKDLILRNFRASDAIALATFYSAPILLRKELLKEKTSVKQ